MVASGAFAEDDRLELIEGWVVQKVAKGPAHEYTVGQLEEFLRAHLPSGWHIRNQAPVTLARSEPEPDLTIARGTRNAYRERHPGPGDLALVVEVADTSLTTDRVKGRSYGDAGIPQYWLVNLPERCIEIHTEPDPVHESGYARCNVVPGDGEIQLVIDGQLCGSTNVRTLLP